MAKKHYHVLIGLCGLYMPDSNWPSATLVEAYQIAKDEKEQAIEDGYGFEDGECHKRVLGNIRRDRQYVVESRYDATDGWHEDYCISISECFESDCCCPHCGALLVEESLCCENCGVIAEE